MSPRNHVDAGGDHGGGMNERRDGRGALHSVGQPDIEGQLRAFSGCSDEKAETDGGEDSAVPCGLKRESGRQSFKAERAEGGEHEENSDEKTEIADAVDYEGFFASGGRGAALEIKPDEQIGGETDALPTDKHEKEVAGEDQDGHEKEEQIEEAEEARVAWLAAHVAERVDVDEEADSGDDEKHDGGKLVEDECEIDLERADGEPVKGKRFRGRKGEGSDRSAIGATRSGGNDAGSKVVENDCEGNERREDADERDETTRQTGAQESVEQEAQERKQRNQPKMCGLVHSFIRSMRSTANVERTRKTAMMMARPTAASAAATIMTKKTKIWPRTSCHW